MIFIEKTINISPVACKMTGTLSQIDSSPFNNEVRYYANPINLPIRKTLPRTGTMILEKENYRMESFNLIRVLFSAAFPSFDSSFSGR